MTYNPKQTFINIRFSQVSSLIFIAFSVFLLASCESTTIEPQAPVDYLGIKAGQDRLYIMDSVKYSAFSGTKDSVRLYFREVVKDVTTDSNGETTFTIDKFLSNDTTKGWTYDSYYFYKKSDINVRLVRGNQIYSQLIFPILKSKKWNVNAFNALDPEYASYTQLGMVYQNYTDCIEVTINNEINFIEEIINKRVYAKDVGLVYQVDKSVRLVNNKPNGYAIYIQFVR
jgi:hypothetical protein